MQFPKRSELALIAMGTPMVSEGRKATTIRNRVYRRTRHDVQKNTVLLQGWRVDDEGVWVEVLGPGVRVVIHRDNVDDIERVVR